MYESFSQTTLEAKVSYIPLWLENTVIQLWGRHLETKHFLISLQKYKQITISATEQNSPLPPPPTTKKEISDKWKIVISNRNTNTKQFSVDELISLNDWRSQCGLPHIYLHHLIHFPVFSFFFFQRIHRGYTMFTVIFKCFCKSLPGSSIKRSTV